MIKWFKRKLLYRSIHKMEISNWHNDQVKAQTLRVGNNFCKTSECKSTVDDDDLYCPKCHPDQMKNTDPDVCDWLDKVTETQIYRNEKGIDD